MLTTPRAAAQRILQGSITPVARGVLRDQDGELADAVGTVTATVKSLGGTVSGSANRATTKTPSTTGQYMVELTTAEAADLTVWAVEWYDGSTLRATTHHRIVGGFICSRAEIKAESGIGSKFSDAAIDLAREWISAKIEHNTGAAWNPRYDIHSIFLESAPGFHPILRGGNSRYRDRLVLPWYPIRTVESFTVDGAEITDYDIDLSTGVIQNVRFYDHVVIGVTHGYDEPPETLRRAAVVAAADVLLRSGSGLSERTRSQTNDLGMVQQFSFPGLDHPTGLDFVDAAIREHDQRGATGVA